MFRWVETLKLVACGNSSKQVADIIAITIDINTDCGAVSNS